MSPDNPFLRALLAQPDDDTLRLAIADWFDENDDPARAEFIRVQVELARGVDERERRNLLEKRQAELLVAHEREWVKPLLEALDGHENELGGWVFPRGKYEAVTRETGGVVVSSAAGLQSIFTFRRQSSIAMARNWLD